MRDFYEILEVERNATSNDIKRAYRKKAKLYHPDLHPDDEEAEKKFKEVTAAYEVLIDENKRRVYDQYGEEGLKGNMGSGNFGDFGDIFDDLFGFGDIFGGFNSQTRRRDPNRPIRGEDIQTQIDITFKEAMEGVEKEITVTREENCKTCNGKKTENPDSKKTCPTCHGSGTVQQVTNSFLGRVVQNSTCPDCHGEGVIIEEPCSACNGTGRERKRRRINVSIPKGVDNRNIMPLRGQGNEGKNGGSSGDLLIVINVKPDKFFKRKGSDLFIEIPITYAQAVLGDKIKVPTINGIVEKQIERGTESGDVIKIKEKGAPHLNREGYGDLYATLNIHVPKNVSKEEEELLEKMMEIQGKSLEKSEKGFFSKIKDFFDND